MYLAAFQGTTSRSLVKEYEETREQEDTPSSLVMIELVVRALSISPWVK